MTELLYFGAGVWAGAALMSCIFVWFWLSGRIGPTEDAAPQVRGVSAGSRPDDESPPAVAAPWCICPETMLYPDCPKCNPYTTTRTTKDK